MTASSVIFSGRRRAPAVSSAVLGMLIFIGTEVMFFAAFISAWMVVSAGAGAAWPPADQPRLPVEATAINTLILLASGVFLFLADRAWKRRAEDRSVTRLLAAALGLGAFFVAYQGFEWFRLIRYGLTMTSSTFGGFFYLIVGAHALHAVAALVLLGVMLLRWRQDRLTESAFRAAQLFWYFVVGLWPVLYWLVYLG